MLCLPSRVGIPVAFALFAAVALAEEAVPAEKVEPTLSESERSSAADAFSAECAGCHGKDGRAAARLNLVDELWHHGGSEEEIARTIRDGVPDTKMEAHKDEFAADEIAHLARYVKLLASLQHARTESPARQRATDLTTRAAQVMPPAVTPAPDFDAVKGEALIDRHIFEKLEAEKIPHAGLSTDAEFQRRAHLDLWGRLPSAESVREFLDDTSPEKRNVLIDKLLGLDFMDKPGHADYKGPWLVPEPFLNKWSYFFGDLFRNGPQGNEPQFYTYLTTWLRFNIPYDYVVRDMLTATSITGSSSGAAGFLQRHQVDGLRCADVMHEDTCDEIALHTTRLFLGVNLECVSCHDGAGHVETTSVWHAKRKRVEFWRQAAFFGNLRIFRASLAGQEFTLLDGPPLRPESIWQGKIAGWESKTPPTRFGGMGYRLDAPGVLRVARDPNADVFPEFLLTKERPAEGANPRHEYARFLTKHPQFARATVNLIWSRFMTTGIVDPVFDWDLDRQDPKNPPPEPWTIQPSHPELIEELASWFRDSGHDLRLLMRTIVRSKAYQLSSRVEGEYDPAHDRYYARKLVRRLAAEEIHDALCSATNVFGHGIKYCYQLSSPPQSEPLRSFLNAFGQSSRAEKQAETSVSTVQAALMMNSDVVKQKISTKTKGSLVHSLIQPPKEGARKRRNYEIVEELYLATLSRYPNDDEMVAAVSHIREHGEKGVEDVQWALVNKLEFIINY